MPGREEILALIPHQGAMCLLDRLVEWNATSVLAATATHRDPANPLRSGGRLRAVHLCEYGAQAMALHGGLLAAAAGESARDGFLVSLRDVTLLRDRVDDLPGEITVFAERLHADDCGWHYRFRVTHGDAPVVEGRVAVLPASRDVL